MLPRYPLPPMHDREWRQITVFQYEEMRVVDALLQQILADTPAADADSGCVVPADSRRYISSGSGRPQCEVLDPVPPAPDAWGPQPQQAA